MSSAGQQLVAGRISGERIATTVETTVSGNVTGTETTVMSVTAPLVNGRTYKVTVLLPVSSSVADDVALGRIREDSVSGTELYNGGRIELATSVGAFPLNMSAEFTAVATGNKTFVATLVRASGTGNITLNAAADRPALLYVDYVEG